MLPLVFVEAFNLNVEKRIGRNVDTALGFDDGGEFRFIGALDGHEFGLKIGGVRRFFEATKLGEVTHPRGVAERAGDERGETRVALE